MQKDLFTADELLACYPPARRGLRRPTPPEAACVAEGLASLRTRLAHQLEREREERRATDEGQ